MSLWLDCKLSVHMAKKELTYKEALGRICEIVAEIERGDLDVDLLSDRVKEASRLLRFCDDKLRRVDADVRRALESMDRDQQEEKEEAGL